MVVFVKFVLKSEREEEVAVAPLTQWSNSQCDCWSHWLQRWQCELGTSFSQAELEEVEIEKKKKRW